MDGQAEAEGPSMLTREEIVRGDWVAVAQRWLLPARDEKELT
jgi:hypothetical protein